MAETIQASLVAGVCGLILSLFAWLLSLHPTASGRVYAAYGGVYILVAVIWLWAVDGVHPTKSDWVGVAVIFEQIKGFSEYGFPESHAASFALLVYASCWIKCHHPAEFLAAMLNSQPLGFYSASQLVQDAKRHGVEVRRVDLMSSEWDCTLEGLPHPPAVRIGLCLVVGLKAESALRILKARRERPVDGAEDLARRAEIEQHEMTLLAAADALMSLAGHRRQQVWEAAGQRRLRSC